MRMRVCLILCLVSLVLSACGFGQVVAPSPAAIPAVLPVSPSPLTPLPAGFPSIGRRPSPAVWNWFAFNLTSLPSRSPSPSVTSQVDAPIQDLARFNLFSSLQDLMFAGSTTQTSFAIDLRQKGLAKLDLRSSQADLMYATFDSGTAWPPAANMPQGFDPQAVMDIGKNPGLGIRQLHALGVTGRGVGIAIIDQPLLVDHQEYTDQLRWYEEALDISAHDAASMHGPAVASIAVGKTVGVAPEADLYYVATYMCAHGTYESIDFACLAHAVRRILEINQELPAERKIRVLSMSIGWSDPQSKGYKDIVAATNEAKKAGMLVVCSSIADVHGFKFHGLGRAPLADSDSFTSYEPGLFWAQQFYGGYRLSNTLLAPMDSRTAAGPTGVNDYAFYREGGWSWSIPYIAGVYALAAQVKPSITPDQFWSLALKTGRTIQLPYKDKTLPFGSILDPQALIGTLQAK